MSGVSSSIGSEVSSIGSELVAGRLLDVGAGAGRVVATARSAEGRDKQGDRYEAAASDASHRLISFCTSLEVGTLPTMFRQWFGRGRVRIGEFEKFAIDLADKITPDDRCRV